MTLDAQPEAEQTAHISKQCPFRPQSHAPGLLMKDKNRGETFQLPARGNKTPSEIKRGAEKHSVRFRGSASTPNSDMWHRRRIPLHQGYARRILMGGTGSKTQQRSAISAAPGSAPPSRLRRFQARRQREPAGPGRAAASKLSAAPLRHGERPGPEGRRLGARRAAARGRHPRGLPQGSPGGS